MATWQQILDTGCPECGAESEPCINPDGNKPLLTFHLARTKKAEADSARRDRVWARVWGGDVATWKQIVSTACPTCYVESGQCIGLTSLHVTFHPARMVKADAKARTVRARREKVWKYLKVVAEVLEFFKWR